MPNAFESPERWKHFAVDFGDDENQIMGIKFIGTGAGTITIAAATGDITFLIDAVADSTIGTAGVVDLSADVTDYHSLVRLINANSNWQAWLIGALPDDDPEAGGSGELLAVTAADASIAGGYIVLRDLSQAGQEKRVCAGLTFNGPSSVVHAHDSQVRHELLRVIAKSTYISGTSSIKVFSCNDVTGVSTLINKFTAGATTAEVAYPAETVAAGEPIAAVDSARIVVKLVNSAAISAVRLKIAGKSLVFGPGMRKDRLQSAY